jgi:hypothetical protein
VGHPALAQHLYGLIGIMRVADDWEQFAKWFNPPFRRRVKRYSCREFRCEPLAAGIPEAATRTGAQI